MTPLHLINSLSSTDPYIRTIFSQGGCYKFHLFLKSMFDNVEPLINKDKDHVVSMIDGIMYDIDGIVTEGYYRMPDIDFFIVEQWSFSRNSFLQIGSCPVCDEPLVV